MADFNFHAKRPLALRLWHWLNAAVIVALLATVLLRDELVGVREHRAMIQQKLASLGVTVTLDQAKAVARLYLEQLWDWHVDLGLALAGLLLVRLVIAFTAPTGLLAELRRAASAAKLEPSARRFALVKASHVAFFAVLTLIVGTGLVLAYSKSLGIPDPVRHEVGEVHESLMYAILAFIAAHVVGVIRAEKTSEPGLVSEMIHGGEGRGPGTT